MEILVCIKQVPDLESRFKADAEGRWFAEEDLAWRMNEYDEYAVEQAVQLKEQIGADADITVLCIGPDRVVECIKKALAMGADRGVHVRDKAASRRDPFQIASIIARYARERSFDLVFTGMQSQDRGSAQVGVILAELLGLPSATTLVEFSYREGIIAGKRELEGGVKGVVRLPAPALVTCQLGLNTPRYPTLPNIMKAKKKEILPLAVEELLMERALSETMSFHPPARRGGGVVLEGELAHQVDRVLAIMREKTTVLR